jgi:hypothetical protein
MTPNPELRACNEITATKSVRPELVEGQPFMVRQAHHERLTVPLILLQAFISETRAWFSKAAHDIRPDAENALTLARETVTTILSFLPDEVRS